MIWKQMRKRARKRLAVCEAALARGERDPLWKIERDFRKRQIRRCERAIREGWAPDQRTCEIWAAARTALIRGDRERAHALQDLIDARLFRLDAERAGYAPPTKNPQPQPRVFMKTYTQVEYRTPRTAAPQITNTAKWSTC